MFCLCNLRTSKRGRSKNRATGPLAITISWNAGWIYRLATSYSKLSALYRCSFSDLISSIHLETLGSPGFPLALTLISSTRQDVSYSTRGRVMPLASISEDIFWGWPDSVDTQAWAVEAWVHPKSPFWLICPFWDDWGRWRQFSICIHLLRGPSCFCSSWEKRPERHRSRVELSLLGWVPG